jgi:predicted SnoaL-like aldol condensation-catalyzing enzyme
MLRRPMSSEENKALVRRFIQEATIAGNLAVIDEICAPDYVDHGAAPEAPAGVAVVKRVISYFRTVMPNPQWTDERMIAEGDLVMVHGVREAEWQGAAFRGVPTPKGKRIAVEQVHVFRVRDGKLAEHWVVRDDLGMMKQLGVL